MRRVALVTTSWLWMIVSCGGGDDPPAGSQADAAPSAEPDAASVVDAGVDASVPDAGVSPPPSIASVKTSDGFVQVRQGSSAELVILGENLGGEVEVRLSGLEVEVLSASAGEIRARVNVPHGSPPAVRAVVVETASGIDSFDSIEVTPYVVSPGAAKDGLGTFQSPMPLCRGDVAASSAGDLIQLSPGTYDCGAALVLRGGQTVQADRTELTTVRHGFRVASPSFRSVTSFYKITIVSEGDGIAISGRDIRATLAVERVAFVGGGIDLGSCSRCSLEATVAGSTFTGAPVAIDAPGPAILAIANSSFSGYTVGIRARSGSVTVADSSFTDGSTGVSLEGFDQNSVSAEIADSVFDDNETGITVAAGRVRVRNTRILDNEVTPRSGERGIFLGDGELDALRVTIAGQATSGIESFVPPERGTYAFVNLRQVVIEGGQYGVRLHGESEGGGLFMSSTTVRGQTIAAVSYGFAHAGDNDLTGDNELSVASGVALEDTRSAPLSRAPINAEGITLNGASYSGLVSGPTELLPDYRIVDDGAIQF